MNVYATTIVAESQWLAHSSSPWTKLRTSVYSIAYPDTEKLIRISKLFQCSLDYLLKDEVEQMDITIAAANEEARINKIRAGVLTYLSFPPIFGWIIGIVSLKFQKDCMKNKVQIVITIAGMLISLLLRAC